MDKIESPRCNNCNLYSETIEHLFYICISIRAIWLYVESICSKHCNLEVTFTCSDVILGYKVDEYTDGVSKICNKCILYCKYYIAQCKFNSIIPTIQSMKEVLKHHQIKIIM